MIKRSVMWILLTAIAGALLSGCGSDKPAQPKARVEPSRTTHVVLESRDVEVAGTVRASSAAEIGSRYGGFVSRVAVLAGSPVKKGDLLVLMDDRSLLAQGEKLKAARQELDEAIKEASYQRDAAASQKQLAVNTFERIRAMYDKEAASKQEYEEAQSRSQSAEAAWQSASQRVAQVESKKRQIDSDMADWTASYEYVRIESPFDGVVTSVPAEQGTYLNPGQIVVSVERTLSYQVLFSVEESLLARVEKGRPVRIVVAAVSSDPVDAVVSEVSPSLEAASRTYRVKADLPASPRWRGGLSANVFVPDVSGSALWAPSSFVNRSQGLDTVMVKQGSEWQRVLVKTGEQKSDRVEILAGVNEGDEIGLFEDVR